ncbi:efflux RND transporter periplasmic adaptor subunit [Halalkalibacter akibai]|uniref:Periplasmic component of efflux system n=1 Tax=Halalkalibacter akibai (strain ATCC 43226 / DSM 21942 / CIP 109018 / JCM 9157 / 1139) TaxID=1236973 RepID=W4QSF0_HALA3|nr:HlyD family efflux transporter periplasmic adaptor subunit [Halalkalibacter akibai]GAE35040.1 periplasmic component of efflux system [Halalkalibacter akibai JCM 9157]
MKKKIWIGLAITVPIILFSTIGVIQSSSNQVMEVKTAQPQIERVKQEIMVPGEIDLAKVEHIPFKSAEDYKLLVEEGEEVAEDAPLIEYSSEDLDFEKEQLALQIEAGYLRINQIGKREDHSHEEQKKLEKEIGRDKARDHYRAERDQLEFEKRTANLDLRQLLNQKEQLEKRTETLVVKSPLAGVVMKVTEGSEGTLTIGSRDRFIATGNLSEYDSLEIEKGQEVEISSDAILDQRWTGVVTDIDFFPSQNELEATGIKYPFTVSVEEDETTVLRPGYQVILNIMTDEREALTVPISAVQQHEDTTYVYIVEEGVANRREVELGLISDGNYEIRSGLDESVEVVVEIPAGLRDGSEVVVID